MADALLSVPLQIALEKLAQVLGQKIRLFAGAARELEKIKNTLQSIKAVVREAESKQVADESVRAWLSDLKSISHDIEDVLDEGQLSGLHNSGSEYDDGGHQYKVCRCLPVSYACFDRSASRYKVACQVKEIRERLDEIAGNKILCSFSTNSGVRSETATFGSRPLTSSLIEESQIIGRVEDRETVISRLVSGSSSGGGVHVTAIVGIGGLGKTTLARQIYHNHTVQAYFNQAVYWVCVSDVFDVMRLTKAILQEVNEASSATSSSELNRLQTELLKSLRGKRFLLVLDDVWNEDVDKWETLRLSLRSGEQGSRILVTTRSENVAKIMNAAYIHKLNDLSNDLSWKLFSSIAFAERKAEEISEVESVGRKIVSKCKGVPLSIKVMGRAMNLKRTRADWQNILDSKMWSLPQVTDKVLPALLLSYSNLPPHLKQCFAYCSIYQKDTVMLKNVLVKLWVAQGFIQPQGNREMEDIGEEYFNDLVACSMFQLVDEYYTGQTACRMHALLHDLAEFITKDESFVFASKKSSHQCSIHVRHASLFSSEDHPGIPITSYRVEKLRTLFVHGLDNTDVVLVDLFHQARFLRVLHFKRCEIKELPKTIGELKHLRYLNLSRSSSLAELPNSFGNMKHLRYLDLSGTNIVELPESVSHLINLHTLNLSSCHSLKKLWRGMGRMVSLRNLEIDDTNSLECLPKGLGRNICLRSLCKFIVGGDEGCRIDELQKLNCLEGRLQILHLERVSNPEEASITELWNKPHLHTLGLQISSERDEEKIVMSGRDDAKKERMEENVLEGLRPHVNLQELSLSCSSSSKHKLPAWMQDSSFSKLTTLSIWGFIHCESNLSGLGKLPALKSLTVRTVGVRKLGDEFYYGISSNDVVGNRGEVAFPKLEQLAFYKLSELEEWALTFEDDATKLMPCLCELMICDCPKLQALPPHLANTPLLNLTIEKCFGIKGVGCSSFPVLQNFTLGHVDEFFSSCLPDLPNLMMFSIDELKNETLPTGGWERLMPLHTLKIRFCSELKSLPDGLALLESLEVLEIIYCKKLGSLPEQLGQLKKLKSLLIRSASALYCLPNSLGQLESLEQFRIERCQKLESLPHSLGQLQKLKLLTIEGSEDLTYLPDSLGQLKSLQSLTINTCPKLESLPHTLQDLSLLQRLDIIKCPLLSEKCKREGVDWHKIAHIHEIFIDYYRCLKV